MDFGLKTSAPRDPLLLVVLRILASVAQVPRSIHQRPPHVYTMTDELQSIHYEQRNDNSLFTLSRRRKTQKHSSANTAQKHKNATYTTVCLMTPRHSRAYLRLHPSFLVANKLLNTAVQCSSPGIELKGSRSAAALKGFSHICGTVRVRSHQKPFNFGAPWNNLPLPYFCRSQEKCK